VADYSRFVDLADSLITEWGQAMTLRHITEGQHYDPHIGATPYVTESEETVYGIVIPLQTGGGIETTDTMRFDDGAVDLAANHRRFVLLKSKDISEVPEVADEMEFGGNVWRVSGVTAVSPGGADIVYRVGLERA
jgi:hypothetical protein